MVLARGVCVFVKNQMLQTAILRTKPRTPRQDHRPHQMVGELVVGERGNRHKVVLTSDGRAHASGIDVEVNLTAPPPPALEKAWEFVSNRAPGSRGVTGQVIEETVEYGNLTIKLRCAGRNHVASLRVVPCE